MKLYCIRCKGFQEAKDIVRKTGKRGDYIQGKCLVCNSPTLTSRLKKDYNSQQSQERTIDSGKSCVMEKRTLNIEGLGGLQSGSVEDYQPNSSPADKFNLPTEQYEALKTNIPTKPPIQPDKFKELDKNIKKEIIEKQNHRLEPYGLVTRDANEIKTSKIVWAAVIIALIGVVGFLWLSNSGMYKSDAEFSPNITLSCSDTPPCPEIPPCPPVSCNQNCTFPSTINVKYVNST